MSNAKVELILLEYGNRLLQVANSQENPTLSDLIETPRDAIKQLMADEFETMIPKNKQKTFQGLIEKGTIQYAHLSGYKDGYNYCINELRQKLEEWKQ